MLRHLLHANGLRPSDLKNELGEPPVVRAILARKRSINRKQVAGLAKRFGVSTALFGVTADDVSQRFPRRREQAT
ncbi:hypothetical protein CDL60_10900 [Roseateles noduli]|nr:hypothetical protein CDL60_10900 [Roseateles noduli]